MRLRLVRLRGFVGLRFVRLSWRLPLWMSGVGRMSVIVGLRRLWRVCVRVMLMRGLLGWRLGLEW